MSSSQPTQTATADGPKQNRHGGVSTKRGSDTQHKVIMAGIRCIATDGFHNSSTNKIAKAAGVTWGTLQHQFGDKARLLEVILQYCVEQQISDMSQSTSSATPLIERIDTLVEAIWRNQQSDSSRTMQEILTGVQTDRELSQRFHPTLQQLRDLYNAQWRELFSDLNIDDELMEAVKQLTSSTLHGLSIDLVVRSSDSSIQGAKEILKQTIYRQFQTD